MEEVIFDDTFFKPRDNLKPFLGRIVSFKATVQSNVLASIYDGRNYKSYDFEKRIILKNVSIIFESSSIFIDHLWIREESFIDKKIFKEIFSKTSKGKISLEGEAMVYRYVKNYAYNEFTKKVHYNTNYGLTNLANVTYKFKEKRRKKNTKEKLNYDNMVVDKNGNTYKNGELISTIALKRKKK